jgi:cytochrome P450
MLAGIDRLAWLGPASPQAAARRCRAGFTRGLSRILDARDPGPVGGPRDALDVLGATTLSRPALADARVAGELFALLLAAHETTATALAWTLELLAHDPTTTARLAVEAATERRPFLDAVISEVLRVRPPLVDIVREVAEPVQLGDQRLAAGTTVLIPPPLIHRHGHPKPDTFTADRFLAQRPNPRTWMPFGGGERRCLGASLALLELREVLAHIARRFEIEPAGERAEDARLHGTALIPARGSRVVLRPR